MNKLTQVADVLIESMASLKSGDLSHKDATAMSKVAHQAIKASVHNEVLLIKNKNADNNLRHIKLQCVKNNLSKEETKNILSN